MRLNRNLLLCCCVVALLPVAAHATGLELSAGISYSPFTLQDNGALTSAIGFQGLLASRVAPHVVADLQGAYVKASEVLGGSTKLYTATLGVKYFATPLYVKNPDGTSTERHTRVNPYFRFSGGVSDGEITGETISMFLAYMVGGGLRWDPTDKSRDFAVDLESRVATGLGSNGESQTDIGVFLLGTLELNIE